MIDLGLRDKVVIITGANSGIGAATARIFASQGARIIIHYLEEDEQEVIPEQIISKATIRGINGALEIKSDIELLGGKAEIVSGNLAKSETIENIFKKAEASFGTASVLINNAAHCESPDNIFETTPSTIDRHFQINTKAPVLLIAEFIRKFKADKQPYGRIVNISTDAAQVFAGQISYGASKAALEAYTRSIAIEIAKYNITVNTIAPGPIQTGYYTKELVDQVSTQIPMQRFGTPEEIGYIVLFLCSRQASYLTGQVLKVSGGHAL